MRAKSIGILLVILGILMIAYTGFSYVTKETVVDLGPLEINKENNHPIRWSPLVGIAFMISGILTIVLDKNKKV